MGDAAQGDQEDVYIHWQHHERRNRAHATDVGSGHGQVGFGILDRPCRRDVLGPGVSVSLPKKSSA